MTPAEADAERLAKEAVKAGKWTPRRGPFYTGLSEERIEKAVAAAILAAHARGREEGRLAARREGARDGA